MIIWSVSAPFCLEGTLLYIMRDYYK